MLTIFYSIAMILSGVLAPWEALPQEERTIYTNGNIYTVYNRPTKQTSFVLSRATVITTISNYHWNNARGTRQPGTIALKAASGRIYGPWSASGSPGMNGVPNANWTVNANIRLEPGEYTVVDSDSSTWSQNQASAGAGMTTIKGYAASSPTPAPTPKIAPTPKAGTTKINALTENRATYKVLIWVAGKEPRTPMDVLNYHLEPGWKGSLPITIPSDGRIKFVAGDGSGGAGSMYDKVLTSCVWSGDPNNPNKFPHIIYEANGALNCATAQKK